MRVWNSKTYLDSPALVREDHLVRKHRRWYGQFYSSNRKKSNEKELGVKNESLEW